MICSRCFGYSSSKDIARLNVVVFSLSSGALMRICCLLHVLQDTGFITVDALVLASLPSHPFGYAGPQQQSPATEPTATSV